MSLQQQLINTQSWEDRYRLIIQAGKNLAKPSDNELATMQLISGCEAKVWFKFTEQSNRTFVFSAYSEARIINGLLWLLLLEIQHKNAMQLQQFSLTDYFSQLHIAQRLSSSRLNGLQQIENIIRNLS